MANIPTPIEIKNKERGKETMLVKNKLLITINKLLERSITHIENEDVSNKSYIDNLLHDDLLNGDWGLHSMSNLLKLQIELGGKYGK